MPTPTPTPTGPVRVLVVSPPAAVWGAQLYLLDQVAPLAERGVDLTLACPDGNEFSDAWDDRGFPRVDLPLSLHTGLRRPGSSRRPGPWSMAKDLVNVVRGGASLARVARDYDVLHSYAMRTHVEVAATGRITSTPTVLDLVNIVRPGLGQRVLRMAAGMASLTVANSAATAATVGTGRRVRVIHPGIDLERFRPQPPDPAFRTTLGGRADVPLVAIVGRVDVRKGIQILIEAMGDLRGNAADAHLAIVGDTGTGPRAFATELRTMASDVLGDRVTFVGRTDRVETVLANVDVLVNASIHEPFGLSVLEAQAVRTPVIGTDAGGIPEFVEHGVSGLLVPPWEAAPLARAIESVFDDPAATAAMVETAYRRAVPARGLAAQYDELAEMYRSVLPTR